MLFEELVITIMKAVNLQRTVSSPYHLIKGKKSGQTIQDIGYYGLHPYFAVMPKLEKPLFDAVVKGLFDRRLLRENSETIDLTEAAMALAVPASKLNGWKYRGKESLFFDRLSLIVQTLSFTSQQINIFDPVHNAEDVQKWVKNYLKKINFRDKNVVAAFKTEMLESLDALSVDEGQKMMLVQRLTGLGMSGQTWQQIAQLHRLDSPDVQLAIIETLHAWMDLIEQQPYPLLKNLLEGIVQSSSLTESAQRTEKLFKNGFSLAEIAAARNLKSSTIEDHFVELAMNEAAFDYRPFMEPDLFDRIVEISRKDGTKRLRDIKEKVPEASYFQIRLALAVKEVT